MNEVHYTIAAAVIIPGVVAAGIFIMPSKEERQTQRIEDHIEQLKKQSETKVAGLFSRDREDEIRVVVLQPFVVMGGVFSVHLEAIGDEGRSALCTNLPIVHDAVLTELHNSIEDPAMLPPGEHLKVYANALRARINDEFGEKVVSAVILAYADLQTFNQNYRRMQTGLSNRCVQSKT